MSAKTIFLSLMFILVGLSGCIHLTPQKGLPPSNIATIDEDFKIEYIEAGQGENIILIHGFGSSIYTWRNNWLPLSEKFHVFAYNTLGIGRSSNPVDVYDVDEHKLQLLNFMDHFDVDKAILVGNSMGAQIALAFAGEYPQRVSALVLIDPSGGKLVSQEFSQAMAEIYEETQEDYDSIETLLFVRQFLEEIFVNDKLVTDEVLENYCEQWKTQSGREALKAIFDQFSYSYPMFTYKMKVSEWQQKTGKAINHKHLIIWGKDDPWFPVQGIEEYVSDLSTGAKIVKVENAGHLPQEEQPEIVNMTIINFLAQ